jgi:hypothetical protein
LASRPSRCRTERFSAEKLSTEIGLVKP